MFGLPVAWRSETGQTSVIIFNMAQTTISISSKFNIKATSTVRYECLQDSISLSQKRLFQDKKVPMIALSGCNDQYIKMEDGIALKIERKDIHLPLKNDPEVIVLSSDSEEEENEIKHIKELDISLNETVLRLDENISELEPGSLDKVKAEDNSCRYLIPKLKIDVSPGKNMTLEDGQSVGFEQFLARLPIENLLYGLQYGKPTYSEKKDLFIFKCSFCEEYVLGNLAIMDHIFNHFYNRSKTCDSSKTNYQYCRICNKVYSAPFKILQHVEKFHKFSNHPQVCHICNYYNSGNPCLLRKHILELHKFPEMPYVCRLCKFRASLYNDIIEHFEARHGDSSYLLCRICLKIIDVGTLGNNSRFLLTNDFYRHLSIHDSNPDLKCESCRLSFYKQEDLNAHIRNDHRKMTNFLPKLVNFSHKIDLYVRKSGLAKKTWNLRRIKFNKSMLDEIRCIECNKEMILPDFIKHIYTFLKCDLCTYSTSCCKSMENHLYLKHKKNNTFGTCLLQESSRLKQPLYCACGEKFNYGNQLSTHLVKCGRITAYPYPYRAPIIGESKHIISEPEISRQRSDSPRVNFLSVLGLEKRIPSKRKVFDGIDKIKHNKIAKKETDEIHLPIGLLDYSFDIISAAWTALQDMLDAVAVDTYSLNSLPVSENEDNEELDETALQDIIVVIEDSETEDEPIIISSTEDEED
ncbi:DgyrCDS13813 [Dimorphilus gyrociliatus]|uniref:DgyrCDS13813 n=1 Tax=Dimorphilus gyrociliatus TaxID=2664684 RepID=A0A7I8WBT9_9ANNE|nr:DgyrCDS13813 [Dimorphilus gyrociliatus]